MLKDEARERFTQIGGTLIEAYQSDTDGDTDQTDIIDAIGDILHWAHSKGIDPDEVLDSVRMHWNAERPGGAGTLY